MPTADRPAPVYAQIANYYRSAILSGDLAPGEKLPSISAIAMDWNVAPATAAKAIGNLQVEGLIYSNPAGSFVADREVAVATPAERLLQALRPVPGPAIELVEVTAAGMVKVPNYVADLLGIGIGDMVIRREEIAHSQGTPARLSVDWVPGLSREVIEELTEPAPLPGGAAVAIWRATGRIAVPVHGRDYLRGRAADAREAGALGLPVGSPILAGVNLWSDGESPLLYSEWVLPPDRVVSYEYEIGGEWSAAAAG